LAEVEEELNKNKQESKITDVERALVTLDLLNKKIKLIQGNSTESSIKEEYKILQQFNDHYKKMELLFQKKACEGDIAAVKSLRPFVSEIKISFFSQLLDLGNFAICQYMVQSFDECLFYLNCACVVRIWERS
jgi:hypothetical protein